MEDVYSRLSYPKGGYDYPLIILFKLGGLKIAIICLVLTISQRFHGEIHRILHLIFWLRLIHKHF